MPAPSGNPNTTPLGLLASRCLLGPRGLGTSCCLWSICCTRCTPLNRLKKSGLIGLMFAAFCCRWAGSCDVLCCRLGLRRCWNGKLRTKSGPASKLANFPDPASLLAGQALSSGMPRANEMDGGLGTDAFGTSPLGVGMGSVGLVLDWVGWDAGPAAMGLWEGGAAGDDGAGIEVDIPGLHQAEL